MFSNNYKNLNKILLFILLVIVGNSFSIYASEDHTSDTQSTNKKRSRPQETENEFLTTEILPNTSSTPISKNDQSLEEPYSKTPKLAENKTPSYLSAIELSQETSSSPGTIPSAPQLQKNRVSSLVAAPSAASSIKPPEEEIEPEDAEKIFAESRVKTNKLAYFYKDEYFDFTEWETESSDLLQKVTSEIQKVSRLRTMNVALAQLSLIYDTGSTTHKIDFMLPYFFMSRWPDTREKPIIEKAFQTAKTVLTPQESTYAAYKSFHVGNGEGFKWLGFYPEFKEHLKNIFPKNRKSSLTPERIAKREQQISEPEKNPTDFAYNYFHSEQAILIYLMHKKDEYLPQILHQIIKEATITTFLLNIVSSNDMCERCGDTFFRATERKSITNIWEPVLKEKEYAIPLEGIHFFIACAGLHKYSDDKGIALRDTNSPEICSVSRKANSNEELLEGIDLLTYKHPRIAQRYL